MNNNFHLFPLFIRMLINNSLGGMKMKKITLKFFFMFIFLLVPMNVFAEDQLRSFTFDSNDSSHPYDMVNSKGEIIKYEDFKNNNLQLINETPSFQGTGIISPVQIDSLIFHSKSFIDLTPSPVIIEDNLSKNTNEITPYIVIGEDGRTIVENTQIAPFSSITYIELNWADGTSGTCTGTLIGRNRVLTNAHCVIDAGTQRGISSATVYPGVSDSTGWFGSYNVRDYFVPSNWISTGSTSEDFAVLVLDGNNNRHAGDVAGFLGIRQVNNLLNENVGIFGYPGDLIRAGGVVSQFGMRGNVTREDTSLTFYTIDTAPGQSGSALLNANNQVVGVHRGSYIVNGNTMNGGPKMNSNMFNFVSQALQ